MSLHYYRNNEMKIIFFDKKKEKEMRKIKSSIFLKNLK